MEHVEICSLLLKIQICSFFQPNKERTFQKSYNAYTSHYEELKGEYLLTTHSEYKKFQGCVRKKSLFSQTKCRIAYLRMNECSS